MNALYMESHLQHQSKHCHEYCQELGQYFPEQNKQRAQVSHLHHRGWLGLRVGNPHVIGVSITELVHFLRLPNAFAAAVVIMALSKLQVTMHVECVIQLGSCSMSCDVSSCVTPSTMSWVMGL
jgi:hypothetical protein